MFGFIFMCNLFLLKESSWTFLNNILQITPSYISGDKEIVFEPIYPVFAHSLLETILKY